MILEGSEEPVKDESLFERSGWASGLERTSQPMRLGCQPHYKFAVWEAFDSDTPLGLLTPANAGA